MAVVTGFLGAGKTTLLNALLRRPDMAGSAVLVNELGDVGLDHLFIDVLDESTILLAGGCLCCAVRGDLVEALRRVRARDPARVLIETTGVADPRGVVETLTGHVAVAREFRLGSILTIVDAQHGAMQLAQFPEAVRQVGVADLIVVSKSDIADPSEVLARVRTLNPLAQVSIGAHGRLPEDWNLDRVAPEELFQRIDAACQPAHGDAGTEYRAISLAVEGALDWHAVSFWLDFLVASQGASILRLKALFNIAGEPGPVVVHGVHHMLYPRETLPSWPKDDPRTSRIVLISRTLDAPILEASLRAVHSAGRPAAFLSHGELD